MPVNIDQISTEFFRQTVNGDNFDQNLTQKTPNLVGSVKEKVMTKKKVIVDWYANGDAIDTWDIISFGGTDRAIKRSVGNFPDDGFNNGDTFDYFLDWANQVTSGTGTITSISTDGKTIYFTLTSGTIDPVVDVTNRGIRGTTDLSYAVLEFGILENDEEYSNISKVTENPQAYTGENIDLTGVSMKWLGSVKDAQSGSATIRKLANINSYTQVFEFEHIFVIPYYVEGQLTNIQNNIPTEDFEGSKSLKYSYQLNLRTSRSDESSGKTVAIDNDRGSVGYFGESLNGYESDYNIKEITYKNSDTNAGADGVLVVGKTQAKIVIEGNFTAGDRFGVYHSYLAPQSESVNTETTFIENFLYDNILAEEGTPKTSTGIIKRVEGNIVGSDLEILVDIEFTQAQRSKLNNLKYFDLSVLVYDNTLDSEDSNQVMLNNTALYDKNADIEGLIELVKMDIIQANGTTSTDCSLNIEDTIYVDFEFDVNLAQEAFINSISWNLEAFNPINGKFFSLDTYNFNLSGVVVSGGIQEININTERNYKLKSGSEFRVVKLITGTKTGDLQRYSGRIAQRIRWEDWKQLISADPVFYDNAKENNGLNYDSSNYSNNNGYEIIGSLRLNVSGVDQDGNSGDTIYNLETNEIATFGYGEKADWSYEIKTLRLSGADLGGGILTTENTLFKTIWSKNVGSFTSTNGYWAKHYLQSKSGVDPYELSTEEDAPTNNLLRGQSDPLRLDIVLNAGNIETSCIIESSLIDSGVIYFPSAHLSDSGSVSADGKLTEAGELKITESGKIKDIE